MDGFVYGAMVGLGFTVTEDIDYFLSAFGGSIGGYWPASGCASWHPACTGTSSTPDWQASAWPTSYGIAPTSRAYDARSSPWASCRSRWVPISSGTFLLSGRCSRCSSPPPSRACRSCSCWSSSCGWRGGASIAGWRRPWSRRSAGQACLPRRPIPSPSPGDGGASNRVRKAAGRDAQKLLKSLHREQIDLAMIATRAASPHDADLLRQRARIQELRRQLSAIPGVTDALEIPSSATEVARAMPVELPWTPDSQAGPAGAERARPATGRRDAYPGRSAAPGHGTDR